MTKEQLRRRKRAVNAALGSVRAEGLEPSQEVIDKLREYAEGHGNIDNILAQTIASVDRSVRG